MRKLMVWMRNYQTELFLTYILIDNLERDYFSVMNNARIFSTAAAIERTHEEQKLQML